MNPTVKQGWLTALRSGEYDQGKDQLRLVLDATFYGLPTDATAYCCLGVLCDLYAKEHPGAYWDADSNFWPAPDSDDQHADNLPDAVREWAGLDANDPWVPNGIDACERAPLSRINDNGAPFHEIADIIEQHL